LAAEPPAGSILNSLVVPNVQLLDGAQQVQAAEEARRASPEARVARERSRTAFAGLGARAAEALAREAFPNVVDRPVDGAPELSAGERIVAYPTDHAAQVEFGGGKHGVIESIEPLATEISRGHREPIDLSLDQSGGAFRPARPAVGVHIPKRLADGVQLANTGVSLTPVDASGAPLGGSEGNAEGATVLYANTQTDADTLVKPTGLGFQEDTILRSTASPVQLSYRVGLPRGARLVLQHHGLGGAAVIQDGKALALIRAPRADDATGMQVPARMGVSGDTLTVSVDDSSEEYEFPIDVDPEVIDETFVAYETNWRFESEGTSFSGGEEVGGAKDFTIYSGGSLKAESWGAVMYPTQGASRIIKFQSESSGEQVSDVDNTVGIVNSSKKWEGDEPLPSTYGTRSVTITANDQGNGNVAEYLSNAVLSEEKSSAGKSSIYHATVTISQTGKPTTSFNTTSPTTSTGAPNLLYTGGWLTFNKSHGEIEEEAKDPGIGVSSWKLSSSDGWSEEIGWPQLDKCEGVQCEEKTNHTMADPEYPFALPQGEDTIEAKASDDAGLTGTATAKVKVDSEGPHEITLTGLPKNDEIADSQYHVTVSATDGNPGVPSSGVASIAFAVDGKEVGKPGGSCPSGPCTASAEWVISGSEFPVGTNTIEITATDNVGNTAKSYLTLFVSRPTNPVPVGPGSVNPESGELTLSATDVSLGAPGSPLTVSRSYGSMHPQAGTEGPLGPQWTLDLASSQNVTKLPNGNALLTTGNALQAVYVSKGGGEFTPPTGDEGLKLTEEAKSDEFVLSDGTGAVTKFSLAPGSSSVWVPTLREGPAGTNATKVTYQTVAGITEPVKEIAAVPAGVKSCSPTLEKGCRALEFVYASKTTATGGGQSEWGDYTGRLKEVLFIAWQPGGAETKTALAQYSYDQEGRLRAEWNPTISPTLKTTYGYDAEGHVSAVTSPGEQPTLLTYGAIAGDTRTGRLLASVVPPATTAVGDGKAPVNTAAPALSTTAPTEGVTMSVTTGTWSNSPLAYEYQWEACYGATCTPIPGATNATYTPSFSNRNHDFTVKVTATNSDGSTVAASNTSGNMLVIGYYERKLEFGKEGTGEGQLKKPSGIAIASNGNVWVADTGNNRIDEFKATGGFVKSFGKEGTGNLMFKEPKGIAIDKEGNIFVADSGNDRIEELNRFGEYVKTKTFTVAPAGVAVGEGEDGVGIKGDEVYITFATGAPSLEAFLLEGTEWVKQATFGTVGSGNGQFSSPSGMVLNEAALKGEYGKNGRLRVVDAGNDRVQVLGAYIESKLSLEYLSQFGTKGAGEGQFSAPTSIAEEPADLTTLQQYNRYLEGLSGAILVVDAGNGRIEQLNEKGIYKRQYAEKGAQGIAINYEDNETTAGDMYVTNAEKGKVTEWVPAALPAAPAPEPPNYGSSSATTIDYHVPVSGSGAPYALGAKEAEAWGQTDDPVEATAVFPPDEPMGWPAKDYKRATVDYYDFAGHTTNVATPSGGVATWEYNATGDVTRSLSPNNRATALTESCESKESCKSAEKAKLLDVESTYNKEGTELEKTLGPQHAVKLAAGGEVQARSDTQYFYDEGAPAEGGPYRLVTKMTQSALVGGKEEEARTTTTSYAGQSNLGWKLREPTATTTNPSGLKLTHTIVYEPSTGEVTETKSPKGSATGGSAVHDSKVVYYTAGTEASVVACQNHPEWAELACETTPAEQPKTAGLPELPVTTMTYNIWDEPEKSTETAGAKTRTTTETYDAAGRLKTSAVSSTVGTAMPTITDEYSSETGALVKECANEGKPCTEGKPKTIASVYNSLGELTSSTDASESTTTYEYDIDGRLKKASNSMGTEAITYNKTTGLPAELLNEYGGTQLWFGASYGVEGNLLTESYPNGMSAEFGYNASGGATSLVYRKLTDCTEEAKEKCVWFKDSVIPSIHGQWLEQTSTLAHEAYTYDADGRLTQVQSTPTGASCTTRAYAYDEDTNGTSLTSYGPNGKGECATEGGGTVEKHTYDEADRLTDTGVKYSEFGDITNLPAADAGGTELTSAFYSDNQLASETQNGETVGFTLDPAGRTLETDATGKTTQDLVDHYAPGGASPAWTTETPSGDWTRYIDGIGGSLAAIQVNGATPVLQLENLHGDIVATAALSETETKLLATKETSEFGVPSGSPAKYSWLGGEQQPTELAGGEILMGARSYIPQLGRFLQPDPSPGGSANAYSYTFGDPVNTFDPSGEHTVGTPSFAIEFNNEVAHQATEVAEAAIRKAAEEAAARAAAEEAAKEAEIAALMAGPQIHIPEGQTETAGWACELGGEENQAVSGCGGGAGGGERGGFEYTEMRINPQDVLNPEGCGTNGVDYNGRHEPYDPEPPKPYKTYTPSAHPRYSEPVGARGNISSGIYEYFGGGEDRFPEIEDPNG